jgi:hypothetical protein
LTGDYIVMDEEEEAESEEREFEPEPEMPSQHFAHGSTRDGYATRIESWGLPKTITMEETPRDGGLESVWDSWGSDSFGLRGWGD